MMASLPGTSGSFNKLPTLNATLNVPLGSPANSMIRVPVINGPGVVPITFTIANEVRIKSYFPLTPSFPNCLSPISFLACFHCLFCPPSALLFPLTFLYSGSSPSGFILTPLAVARPALSKPSSHFSPIKIAYSTHCLCLARIPGCPDRHCARCFALRRCALKACTHECYFCLPCRPLLCRPSAPPTPCSLSPPL